MRVHDNPLKIDNICEVFYRFRGIQHSVPPVELSGQLEAGHRVSLLVKDGGRCTIYFKVIQLNCGVRNKFNLIIAVLNAI